ncbi:amino acid adenylation domain-containing protein [Streptomyces sp. NPDC102283]|uniref:amino acid adenylation domain-containing protein n=1 Tax=Streptomyces sp. NPDC102283 TaxID=3366155 RepID=UPI003818B24B
MRETDDMAPRETTGPTDRTPPPALCSGPALTRDHPVPADVGLLLAEAASKAPDRGVLTVDEDGRAVLTPYPELLERSHALLAVLREHGCVPGDTVVLHGLALPDFFPFLWACLGGGLVPLAVEGGDEAARLRTAERTVQACALLDGPRLVTDAAGAARLRAAGLDARVRLLDADRCRQEAEALPRPAARAGRAPADPASTALLLLSSGSTGRAKVIPLTHAGLLDFVQGSREALGWRTGEATLNWLPVDHSASLLLYHLLPVHTHSTNVHVPAPLVLGAPLSWLDLCAEHRVRHTWAPTFGYQLLRGALAEQPGRDWDLSAIRTLVSGGEQILPEVVDALLAATAPFGVPGDCFVAGWGMSETCTGITWGRYGEPGSVQRVALGPDGRVRHLDAPAPDALRLVGVGRPAPGADVRVVDDHGHVLPEETVGRLQVRSARITPGYLGDDEANSLAFPGGTAPGAWFDSGDLAYVSGGRVVMTGRRKDIVVLNGENHYCHAIEAVVAAVPGVSGTAVAVCGVPDPATGSEALAVFLAGTGGGAPAPEVITAVRAELARRLSLVARHVVGLTAAELPRTSSGKIRRAALAALLPAPGGEPERRSASGPGAAAAPGTVERVRRAVREVLDDGAAVDAAHDRVPLRELGVTSVMLGRLSRLLQREFARELPMSALFEHHTIARLAAHLGSAPATPAPATPAPVSAGPSASGTRPHPRATDAEEPVAVIGMALRFPGAGDPDSFWDDLRHGRNRLTTFTPDQQRAAGLSRAAVTDPARRPVAGVLDGVHAFDPPFFGMSPAEAALTHPGHRLFLECAYEALESAGHAEPRDGVRIGVYAGSGMNLVDYQRGQEAPAEGDLTTSMRAAIGGTPDFLATRAAYRLGLTGPALSVQTACSTSLVAVHLAVQALRGGDADMALAGAAAVHLPQESGYVSHPDAVLSPTGACSPFDADADGTVGGNGVAAVLLKPLSAALADGDPVLGLITGTAVNNDGARKIGFTAPSVDGQVDVVRTALRRAGITGDDLGYIEAHGTGTPIGDPVEFAALSRALAATSTRTGHCAVGSVKGHIGHLDTCAGMAGLIKVLLMLRHRAVVPSGNLRTPNPALGLSGSPLRLATAHEPLSPARPGAPLRAGVNALGVGGTNAFVVVESAPEAAASGRSADRGSHPVAVPLTAPTEQALGRLAADVGDWLRARPGTGVAAVAASLAARPARSVRAVAVVASEAQLLEALDGLAAGPPRERGPLHRTGRPAASAGTDVVLAYSGQGTAVYGMARELYEAIPAVRDVLDHCDRVHTDEHGAGLLEALLRGTPGAPLPARLAQPALFALQAALTAYWRALGVVPGHVLGHSLGEIAALHAAGGLSLDDGVRLTAARGRLMAEGTAEGAMLAARLGEAEARRVARTCGLDIGARNGADSVVLSGTPDAIAHAERLLRGEDVPARRLAVDRAFHSALIDPVLDPYARSVRACALGRLEIALIAGTDGTVHPAGSTIAPRHLVDQARRTARFDLQLRSLSGTGAPSVVEVGPRDELTVLGRRALPHLRWIPTVDRSGDPARSALLAAGELYCQGHPVDLGAGRTSVRRVPLPTTPFQRRDFRDTDLTRAPRERLEQQRDTDMPDELLTSVTTLAARHLGLRPDDVEADTEFIALGGDSLTLVALARDVEREHGLRVPVRELFDTWTTPRALAQAVASSRSGAGAVRDSGPRPAVREPEVQEPAVRIPAAREPAVRIRAVQEPLVPEPAVQEQVPEGGPAAPALSASADPEGVGSLLRTQLEVVDNLVRQVTGLMERQLDKLPTTRPALPVAPARPAVTSEKATAKATAKAAAKAAAPADTPARVPAARAPAAGAPAAGKAPAAPLRRPVAGAGAGARRAALDFSLYFFGDYPDHQGAGGYENLLNAAEFADRNGFHTVWLPERHFHSFGGLFPNPSVLAAALATRTSRVRLHAGSVVLPLHHPIRVAEEWAMVDNLSDGRAGVCIASGWHARDFVLAPGNFGRHRELMYEQLEDVRTLWSGGRLSAVSGTGEPTEVTLYPRPVQDDIPLFAAVVDNPESYRRAALQGLGIVTNLMSQSVAELADNIALYRCTREEGGLDPAGGRVVVLLHTYLGEDLAEAREEAAAPFVSYLRSSLSLFDRMANSLGLDADLERTAPEDVDFLLRRAYERYCESRALIGTVESGAPIVEAVRDAGADEIACFVDFGMAPELMAAGLPLIRELNERQAAGGTGIPPVPSPVTPVVGPVAPLPRPATASVPVRDAGVPVPPAQRRLWLLEQMYPGSNDYHEPKGILLTGRLNHGALQDSLDRVVARHPQLRAVFRESDGEVRRFDRPAAPVPCPVIDREGVPVEEALAEAVRAERHTVFDLARGPLLLARLIRLSDEQHLLYLHAHHIVFDSFSTRVFVRDLGACYRAWPGLPAGLPPVPVGGAPSSPGAGGREDGLAFWVRELHGAPALALPTDRPRSGQAAGRGAHLVHEFGPDLADRLSAFARDRGATPFMVLVAAVGAVLGRMSGQEDVLLGTAVTNRPAGTEDAVGLFVDTVVLRIDLSGEPGFGGLVRRVRERSTRAYDHQDVSFDDLVTALNPPRVAGANPLFQVMVEYEKHTGTEFAEPAVRAEILDVPSDRAPFDLTLYLARHDGGLRCTVEYRADLYEEATVRRLLDYVARALERGCADPDVRPADLTALTEADRDLLAAWQGPAAAEAPATLHGLVRDQARATPHEPAVIDGDAVLTYAELDAAAGRLARGLAGRGVGRGDIVAVGMARGAGLVVALLSVLRAGAAYLPLDPAVPTARLEHFVADSEAVLVVSDADFREAHPGLEGLTEDLHADDAALALDGTATSSVDSTDPVDSADPAGWPDARDDIAYLIYTSGSTGRPKAVRVPHRGPVNLVRWHLRENEPLRTAQWTSAGFDVSVQEIFTTLASGAALVTVPDEARADPAVLEKLLDRHQVERLHLPSTPLKYVTGYGLRVPSLKEVCAAGEPLLVTPGLRAFLDAHPGLRLFNQYGPTEASVIVTSHEVTERDGQPVPIGRPLSGVTAHVLDAAGRHLPVGAVGELHIGGEAPAAGYLGDPGLTAERFVTHPLVPGERLFRTGDLVRRRGDGVLEFVGRLDDQVKVRGHRVEPGEARSALCRLDGVRDAAVTVRTDERGENTLVAHVVLAGEPAGGTDWADPLRAALRAVLPDYLVPERWVRVPRLPVGPSGKIAVDRLPEPPPPVPGADAPDATEQVLHDLWCDELGVASLPGDRSFFDLGGNSLRAVRVLTRVRDAFGVQYPMADFVREPTLRAMARGLSRPTKGPGSR